MRKVFGKTIARITNISQINVANFFTNNSKTRGKQ